MVLSALKKLLRYVDEHPSLYKEMWDQFSTQFNSTTDILEKSHYSHAFLVPQLQQRGLQIRHIDPHLLYAEHSSIETPHTLLFCHSYAPHATSLHMLTDSIAFLSALDAYKNVRGSLPINIQWLQERRGDTLRAPSWDHDSLSARGRTQGVAPTLTGCIWYHDAEIGLNIDTLPILALGTKGLLHVELAIQTASSMIDSMHAGIAPNPLWRLLWALNSLKDAREDILIEGFYDTLIPASDDAIAQLQSLPDTTADLVQRWGIQQPLMGLQGFQLHYAHLLLPTCTVHAIISNPQSTSAGTPTIPMQAKAQVSFYLVPEQDPQDIFMKLQRHLQSSGFSDVHTRLLSSSSPINTSLTDPFVQRTLHATQAAYAQKPLILPTTLGSYTGDRMKAGTPIVFIPRNMHVIESGDTSHIASMVKQIILLIEGIADANATTQ